VKLIMIGPLKNGKKRGRQAFDRPFELGFGPLLSTKVLWGVGFVAERHRQRAAKIAVIAAKMGAQDCVQPWQLIGVEQLQVIG
jgi:hypothetical protein